MNKLGGYMPHTTYYDQKMKCIVVTVQGVLDLSLLQRIASDVAQIIAREGCKYILNDLRKAKATKKTMEIYNMPNTAKKAGVTHGCKRALVVAEETTDFHFLETVFINQGHHVKIFNDIESAKAWLFDDQKEQTKKTIGLGR
jgi:hypothetical protein